MMKCDELENKDYNNGITAYELMEENGLVNTAKAVKDAIAELKQKLEDVQASHYAERVDAGMRERRLKRALWRERAERAKEKAFNWRFRNPNNNNCLYGINYLVEYDERKIRRTNNEWFEVFSEVERKCRAKAEEYK